MQVNLSANLPNSTGEAAPTISKENADTGSGSAFLAQMDQIWNPNNGNGDARIEETSGKQISGPAFNNSENPLPGISNPFAKQAGTEPVSTLNPSDLTWVIQGDANTLTANNAWIQDEDPNNPMIPKESAGARNSKTEVPPQAQTAIETSFRIAREENAIQATETDSIEKYIETLSAELLSIFPPSGADRNLQTSVLKDPDFQAALSPDSDFIVPVDLRPSLDSRVQIGSSQLVAFPGKPEDTVHAASETIGTSDAQGLQQAFRIQSARHNIPQAELGNAPPDSIPTQTMLPESREDLLSRSGSSPAPKDFAYAGNPLVFRAPDLQSESSQVANSAKPANMVYVALDKASTGDSPDDQNAPRNESASWTALQNKWESVAPDSNRLRVPVAERQAEMPSPSASILSRGVESSSPQVSNPVQNVASQPQELIQQIAERIQIQLRDGKSEIVVQLKPDSLGRLEIRAETTSNGVVARITTESGSVKGYLENNLHLLQQTLQDQGLKIDRIHIIVQDSLYSQSSGYAAQFGHTGSGGYGGESHKSSETSGNATVDPPEEVIVDPTAWISLNPNTRFHTVA